MFRLHFPRLAPTAQQEFSPDPKWEELRETYAAQYPDWVSRATTAENKLKLKLRRAWPYHHARILAFFRAIAIGSAAVDKIPAAIVAYESAGGQFASAFRLNVTELSNQGYLLSSFALAGAQSTAEQPDAKFALWKGRVALRWQNAAFASASLKHATKFRVDAERQLSDLQAKTRTMNAGNAAAGAGPKRGVRA